MSDSTTDNDPTHVMERVKPKRRKGPIITASVVGGLAVLAGATYVAGYVMAGDNTPRNASVQGVAIGGMTAEQAQAKLKAELGPKAEAAITVQGNGKSATINPAQAGLTVDYAKTVEAAGAGRSWNPSHIVQVLRGGTDLDLVTSVDQAKLDAAITSAAPTFVVKPKNASLAMSGQSAKLTPGVDGSTLNNAAAATAVQQAWLKNTSVEAPLTTTPPAITTQAATQVKTEYADPALSGPITMKTGDGKSFQVDVAAIAAATSFPIKDGKITGTTDAAKVFAATKQSVAALKFPAGKDATITLVDGKPKVTPSQDGMGITEANFTKAFTAALTKTGAERSPSIQVTKVPAKFTTEDANKLGVKEVTGEFTTNFPYAEYRNVNLSRAAASINNTFLKPGEVFSLDKVLGARTEANGYVAGYVISGDKLVKETAGGVSQSSTTTFNAAFFAGLKLVEHQPHTMYFPRYPAGREATLYGGSIDMKFANDTDHGVLVQAFVKKASPGTQGSITVRIWSTKDYTKVASSELVKSDYYTGTSKVSDSPSCEYQAPSPGFTVNYSRLFYQGNSVVKTEKFRWQYAATDEIKCKA